MGQDNAFELMVGGRRVRVGQESGTVSVLGEDGETISTLPLQVAAESAEGGLMPSSDSKDATYGEF